MRIKKNNDVFDLEKYEDTFFITFQFYLSFWFLILISNGKRLIILSILFLMFSFLFYIYISINVKKIEKSKNLKYDRNILDDLFVNVLFCLVNLFVFLYVNFELNINFIFLSIANLVLSILVPCIIYMDIKRLIGKDKE